MERILFNKSLEVVSRIKFIYDDKPGRLSVFYRKVAAGVLIFVDIDEEVLGEFFCEDKSFFQGLHKSLIGLSESPYSNILGTNDEKSWEAKFPLFKEFPGWKEIEEKISFHTLLSAIELYFPTNWFLMLPDKKD